jgi:uncharacterized iron-regulated membrane protein
VFVRPHFDPQAQKPFQLGYDQVFVDPVTGDILGQRQRGICCLERQNLIPFLYKLHYTLFLPEPWGRWLFGVVAVIWTIDCFIGAYLTLPRRRIVPKWATAWRIKRGASPYRLNFDLHRAGGLWLWAALLALAVSSVYLNLNREVFRPVVTTLSSITPSPFETRTRRPTSNFQKPALSYDDIVAAAREEAARRGWSTPPGGTFYSASQNIYGVNFRPYQHRAGPGIGAIFFYFDGDDGRLIGERQPGTGTAGDIALDLQFPLHSGEIAGLTGRIIVAIAGIVVAMLSVTGVVIWSRKRRRLSA